MIPYGALFAGIEYALAQAGLRFEEKADPVVKQEENVIDVESRWVDDPPEPPKLPLDPKTLHSR